MRIEPSDIASSAALRAWMAEHGYTHSSLARELGIGYDLAYKLANDKAHFTDGFKWRFAGRFNAQEAAKIFDVPSTLCDFERPLSG